MAIGLWLLFEHARADGFDALETIVALAGGALYLVMLAGWWATFEKAGVPGWTALVPLYPLFVILEIAGKPWWWVIFPSIPVLDVVMAVVTCVAFAKRFGKGVGFALGLTFLPFVFYPILASGTRSIWGRRGSDGRIG